jgi:hypothetical protein
MTRYLIFLCVFSLSAFRSFGADRPLAVAFESGQAKAVTEIDRIVFSELEKHGLQPANLCCDEVFVRRAYVDITGAIPTWQQTLDFLEDKSTDKRSRLIDELLDSPGFIDYTTMYWCNVLRVKSEFPINLWPNAVQAYHRRIREMVEANISYDEFARRLLTSSGSNFRTPEVNFYRGIQGKAPADIASAVCLTFMGIRYDKQSSEFQENMGKFFSRLAYKSTGEWKEEIVYCDPLKTGAIETSFPDGTAVMIKADRDPREVFCEWLVSPENEWFKQAIVNRVWARLMGRGIIEPVDDIDPESSIANKKLLAFLENELIKNNYDLKSIYRLILNSSVWQLSAIPSSDDPQAAGMFAHYNMRRLDAEVLCDALAYLSGSKHDYSSMVPEPYTFIPGDQSTVELADGSITSQFLEMFGRPSRDTGTLAERNSSPSDSQLLHILNSTDIHTQIRNSEILNNIVKMTKNNEQMVERLYLLVLCRYPTDEEALTAKKYINTQKKWRKRNAEDIMWALINTKEFLYRH